jgi:N-acetylglucosaminyl-diphospho-decaprenol L-rhamnosyltransferase
VEGAPLGPLDPTVDVSVIIVNWNTRELLRDCLASLYDTAGAVRVETIVVDNASTDGSAEMVRRSFPQARLLVNRRNMGFAAANNQGLAIAHSRYALLLNSDTVVLPGALAAMARYMDAHPCVGALGPRLLNADRSLQSSARDFPRPGPTALAVLEVDHWPLADGLARRYERRTSLHGSDHRRTREVDWLMGACLLLRRDAIARVGGLDEGYFFFAEEMDLCYRLRQLGWRVVFLAAAEIVHLGGQSSARVPAARVVWHYAGLLRFYQRHYTRAAQVILRGAIIAAVAQHLVRLALRHARSPQARPLVTAYMRVLVRALIP